MCMITQSEGLCKIYTRQFIQKERIGQVKERKAQAFRIVVQNGKEMHKSVLVLWIVLRKGPTYNKTVRKNAGSQR